MRRIVLASVAALALCGPARAFDFPPEGFAAVYNAAAVKLGRAQKLELVSCDDGKDGMECVYTFGYGTRTLVTGAKDPSQSRTVEFLWNFRNDSTPGIRSTPSIMVDIGSPTADATERGTLFRDVFNGDLWAKAKPRDPVMVGGVSYASVFLAQQNVVIAWMKDTRLP